MTALSARLTPRTRGKAVWSFYDLPELREAQDAFWAAVARRLLDGGLPFAPERLTRDLPPEVLWTHPDLILAQTCGYTLATRLQGQVQLVATPLYRVRGCDGGDQRSAIVVRADHLANSLDDLRGGRCAVNDLMSDSGANRLRAEIAPLAHGRAFFSAVNITGSHLASLTAVARDDADLAAIDSVTLAHLARWRPELVAQVRVLTWTVRTPGAPLITSLRTDLEHLALLREALADVARDPALRATRDVLLLDGFEVVPVRHYRAAPRLADIARDLGYPHLA